MNVIQLKLKAFEAIKNDYQAIHEALQLYPNVMESEEGLQLLRDAIHFHKLMKNMPYSIPQVIEDKSERDRFVNFYQLLDLLSNSDLSRVNTPEENNTLSFRRN